MNFFWSNLTKLHATTYLYIINNRDYHSDNTVSPEKVARLNIAITTAKPNLTK